MYCAGKLNGQMSAGGDQLFDLGMERRRRSALQVEAQKERMRGYADRNTRILSEAADIRARNAELGLPPLSRSAVAKILRQRLPREVIPGQQGGRMSLPNLRRILAKGEPDAG